VEYGLWDSSRGLPDERRGQVHAITSTAHHICHRLRPAAPAAAAIVLVVAVCLWTVPARAQTAPAAGGPPDSPQPGAEDPRARPADRPAVARNPAPPPVRTRPRRQARDTEVPAPPPASPRGSRGYPRSPSTDTAPTRAAKKPSTASPVVRAVAGNWGMFFRFGGLASLDHGNNTRSVDGLLLTQVGFRYVVSEKVIIPMYFSLGVRLIKPPDDTVDDDRSWGLEMGSGIEYHFRIWRRISPFIAFNLGLGVSEPNGASNRAFGIGFGPAMGVEYYIADRVSLTVQYMMALQIEIQQTPSGMGDTEKWQTVQFSTIAGGAVNITYYF